MEIVRSVGVTTLVALMAAHRAVAELPWLAADHDDACNRQSAASKIPRPPKAVATRTPLGTVSSSRSLVRIAEHSINNPSK
jgi:hypothetical protein